MITTAQHTCLNIGTDEDLLKNSPFIGIHNPIEDKHQFLGTGYYFWDDNIEMARIWGKKHCNNSYVIIETEIDINQDKCFDLVGNRKHMKALLSIVNHLKLYGYHKEKWVISQCIEFLKDKELNELFEFNYECVRAIDYVKPREYNPQKYLFVKNTDHYTILNPKIAICIIDRKYVPLQPKTIKERK